MGTPEKLTDAIVRDLPAPEKGNRIKYDGGKDAVKGFGVRITAKGAKSFILNYRLNGREERYTIGAWSSWKVAPARSEAKRLRREMIDRGISPLGEREEARKPVPKEVLFKQLAEDFLEHGRTKKGRLLRPATKKEYRRALIDYATVLHARPVEEIRRREIVDLIRKVAKERGTTSAVRTRAALSRFFGWLLASDKVDANPVTGTEGYEVGKGKRVLDDDELRAVWNATAEPIDFNLIVRLCLWAGTRRAEPGAMADSEFEHVKTKRFDGQVWKVPGSRTKNHRDLWLPLPRQAREALEAWPRTKDRDMIFGRVRRDKDDTGFQGWSDAKAELNGRIARLRAEQRLGRKLRDGEEPSEQDVLPPWILHDLRRTVETRLAEIGVAKDIANRVLNHAQGPITETYDQHDYLPEKAAALQLWADELQQIVGDAIPENVLPLRRETS